MRFFYDRFALTFSLLSLTLTVFLYPSAASPQAGLSRLAQLPFQVDPPSLDNRSWLLRFRDGLIQSIWRTTSEDVLKSSRTRPLTRSGPPSKLLARYGGDLVLRFEINSSEEAKALAKAVNVLFLDVWEFTKEWVDIRLSKDVIPSLLGLLPISMQNAHTPLMHDLAQAIFESYPSLTLVDPSNPPPGASRPFSPDLRPSADEANIFFREYQPLNIIRPWMRLLHSLFPSHVRTINIGISYEGRDIPALRVGVHPTNSEKPSGRRETIIVTGGSHAREWISTSSVNYVAYSFITSYGKSKTVTKLLERFDWIFVPTLNPDGYAYTWENDRLWRKNRQQTELRFCKGVDLDRSYGFEWDSNSSQDNPCSESFPGRNPFEGVESRHFANWIRNETEKSNSILVGFLDFHSYSQQVLYPCSYSYTLAPPALQNLEELAIGMAKALGATNGVPYSVASACGSSVISGHDGRPGVSVSKKSARKERFWPRIESGGGSALDWIYHELNVSHTYQIKLRDTGSYGFLLPSKNIVPTGAEAFRAVEYFGHYVMANKYVENLSDNLSSKDAGGRSPTDYTEHEDIGKEIKVGKSQI